MCVYFLNKYPSVKLLHSNFVQQETIQFYGEGWDYTLDESTNITISRIDVRCYDVFICVFARTRPICRHELMTVFCFVLYFSRVGGGRTSHSNAASD